MFEYSFSTNSDFIQSSIDAILSTGGYICALDSDAIDTAMLDASRDYELDLDTDYHECEEAFA